MRRIAITQRIDAIPGRDETRDALDARWGRLLWSLGFAPLPLASGTADPAGYVAEIAPDGILLSGGNDIGAAPARDALETAALEHAAAQRIPVFGVCRGMQMINDYQGGRLQRVEGHVAVYHHVTGPFARAGREVNSYHDYAIAAEGLGRDLEVLASAPDGTVEALRHATLPWLAVMWHPEREEPVDGEDADVIRNLFET